MSEIMNKINHYDIGGMPMINVMKAKMSPEEFNGFCKGNVYKYLARSGHKDDEVEDLKKAKQYLIWLIENKKVGGYYTPDQVKLNSINSGTQSQRIIKKL